MDDTEVDDDIVCLKVHCVGSNGIGKVKSGKCLTRKRQGVEESKEE